MKALFFETHGTLDVLQYGDFPAPEIPAGWVKVKVNAASLNYMDIFSRQGIPGVKIELPGITGSDCAGEVAELGEGVEGWNIGERVLIYSPFVDREQGIVEILGESRRGALAEYCICRASQLMRIPDNVSDEMAASLPCAYGTAYRMLHTRGKIQAGEKMLILGASGGVGTACLLLAKLAGCEVYAAAGSDEKCAQLKELGADVTINYRDVRFDKFIREKTGSLFSGGGCEVVVNFTGGDTWVPSLRCVKHEGRLLCCGATAGHDPKTDLRFVFSAEMDIRGSSGWSFEDQQALLDMVSGGELKPVIDTVYPLSEGRAACARLEDRSVLGKIIVKPEVN